MDYKFKLTRSQLFKMLIHFTSNKSTCEKYDSTLRLELSKNNIRICLEDRKGKLIARGEKVSLDYVDSIRLPNVFYQHEVKLELEK